MDEDVFEGSTALPARPHPDVTLPQLLALVGRALVNPTRDAIAALTPYVMPFAPGQFPDFAGEIAAHALHAAPGDNVTWRLDDWTESPDHKRFDARVQRKGRPDAAFLVSFQRKPKGENPGCWHVHTLSTSNAAPAGPPDSS